jgi:hypothetical protein
VLAAEVEVEKLSVVQQFEVIQSTNILLIQTGTGSLTLGVLMAPGSVLIEVLEYVGMNHSVSSAGWFVWPSVPYIHVRSPISRGNSRFILLRLCSTWPLLARSAPDDHSVVSCSGSFLSGIRLRNVGCWPVLFLVSAVPARLVDIYRDPATARFGVARDASPEWKRHRTRGSPERVFRPSMVVSSLSGSVSCSTTT